jgi:CBS domain-containing protein
MIRIDQLMSHPVVTCRVSDNLATAAGSMWDHDCGAVVVVDDAGRLVGIVTDRDICMAAYTQGHALHEIPVATAMAREVFTCRRDDDLARAEEMMERHKVRRIPVVDAEGRPLGLLSLGDLARKGAQPSASQQTLVTGFARTLAAICRPHPQSATGTAPGQSGVYVHR